MVFFGTPAEEDVGGKIYMARDGLFDDVDAMLGLAPGDETQADCHRSQAMVDLAVEFRGTAAHAAERPVERPQRAWTRSSCSRTA